LLSSPSFPQFLPSLFKKNRYAYINEAIVSWHYPFSSKGVLPPPPLPVRYQKEKLLSLEIVPLEKAVHRLTAPSHWELV
jgi:hypothetical protein